jgi:hypothetical protein
VWGQNQGGTTTWPFFIPDFAIKNAIKRTLYTTYVGTGLSFRITKKKIGLDSASSALSFRLGVRRSASVSPNALCSGSRGRSPLVTEHLKKQMTSARWELPDLIV